MPITHTFTPKSKAELQELIKDDSVYLGDIDTSAVTDMSFLFENPNRKDFSGISSWDVSKVENMNFMFFEQHNFNENLNSWNTSALKSMNAIFADCVSFNQPLDRWNVGNVRSFRLAFGNCRAFDHSLKTWQISKGAITKKMFENCAIKSQNKPVIKQTLWARILKIFM